MILKKAKQSSEAEKRWFWALIALALLLGSVVVALM